MGQTVRPIITSGTVAAGGVLISAVDGTAFIDVDTSKTGAADFSTAILAAVANNDVIELTSKTNGRKIYGYAKAAGSSETLGDELITNGNMETGDPPTGWDVYPGETTQSSQSDERTGGAGSKSLQVVYASNLGRAGQVQSATTGGLYYYTAWRKAISGTATVYFTGVSQGASTLTEWAQNTAYLTQSSNANVQIRVTSGSTARLDDVSVKQVLTPSSAGVTLTNTAGGSTYNFALKDSAFTYNDTAGYNYRILSSTAYGKLIATQSPVSGTLHIATKNGEAMFFHDSIDFSAYAGTDAGSTPYLFVFYDNTGKSAQAYAGAIGGGEALGSEINTGTLTAGTLYKITATEVNHFGTGLIIDSYFTSTGTETCDANNKVKALTDIAATGLHLMSAKNGTTRNMKSMESGFNPNTITRVNIYRAYVG